MNQHYNFDPITGEPIRREAPLPPRQEPQPPAPTADNSAKAVIGLIAGVIGAVLFVIVFYNTSDMIPVYIDPAEKIFKIVASVFGMACGLISIFFGRGVKGLSRPCKIIGIIAAAGNAAAWFMNLG